MRPPWWLPMSRGRAVGAALALSVFMAIAGAVHGQTAVAPEAVAAIARSLNCPLCQGYNLQDCPLEVCSQMRETIRQKLAAGATRDQIVADFVADYGPQVLSAPPRTGWLASAWLAPPVFLLLLAVVGVLALRSVASRSGHLPIGRERPDPAEAGAYEAEVERLLGGEDDDS